MAELKDLPNQRPSGFMSTPTSPKTKSAPTISCSVPPTAFHQHNPQMNSQQNQNQSSTLPSDIRNIRMNMSTTQLKFPRDFQEDQEFPETAGSSDVMQSIDEQLLDGLIRSGDSSLESGHYEAAIKSYSDCIELAERTENKQYLKNNFKVYLQRAEAYFNARDYNEASNDCIRARDINPKCSHIYLLQGKSLFLLGDHGRALAVFSYGLAQDPTYNDLFNALVGSALESEFRERFEPNYSILKAQGFDKETFLLVAIVGQELLLLKHHEHAVVTLESALKIGTENKKWRNSVLSTISYAYCIMEEYGKAVGFMKKELEAESELEDVNGQCRVLTNLGYAYYKLKNYDKSLEAHRKQVKLAMLNSLFPKVSMGLNALGHVHMAKNDLTGALTSHTRCLEILRQLNDNTFNQFKELLSIGHIHTMLGDYKVAEERYNESLKLLNPHNSDMLIMLKFNLAYLALRKQKFPEAKKYYTEVSELAHSLPEQQQVSVKRRASVGISHVQNLLEKCSLNYVNETEVA